MRALYIITQKDFFQMPHGGAVSHHLGIFDGLGELGYDVTIIQLNPLDLNVIPTRIKKNYLVLNTMQEMLSFIAKNHFDFYLIRKNIKNLLWLNKIQSVTNNNKLCVEINGLSLQNMQDKSIIGKLIYNLIKFLHCNYLQKIHSIYVVNQNLKTELRKLDTSGKIIHIENGIPFIKKTVKKGSTKKILFFGRFQNYNDYKLLLSLESYFLKNNIILEMIGDGPEFSSIKHLFRNSKHVIFRGFIERSDFLKSGIVSSKTIGIIPLNMNKDSKYLSPIKLYEYLAMKIPVVYSSSMNVDVSTLEGAVFKYDVGSKDSCIESIKSAFALYENIYNVDWVKLIENHSWDERMKLLVEFYNRD